jgi:NADPH:quinone reductase-like Zn-dependent oxidoreductase
MNWQRFGLEQSQYNHGEKPMKAIIHTKYGPPEVLQFQEVEKPAPLEGEVLVKVFAASVNIADYYTMQGGPTRIVGLLMGRKPDPRVGTDLCGRIEAVGPGVARFQPGDEVFGGCTGSFAEYATTHEDRLALKPANRSFEEAAAVPVAGITALQGLRDKGQIRPGQKVLINGASGGVGTFAVQIAKSFGAEVTAVCSPRNIDQARSIGADHVIDYTREDFTRSGLRYDLILGVNGYHPILAYRGALTPQGAYVFAGASSKHVIQAALQAMLLGPLISRKDGQKFGLMGIAKFNPTDLGFLKDLLETGKIVPVIDRSFPLSEAAEALRYIGDGHARGKIIITMEPGQ